MTMKVTRVKWDARGARETADKGAREGLEKAQRVVELLANEHAPLDTGKLIGSANTDYDGKVATVYYDTPYAVKLHQDRRLKIKHGREGLWLKKALLKARPQVLDLFRNALRIRFARGNAR